MPLTERQRQVQKEWWDLLYRYPELDDAGFRLKWNTRRKRTLGLCSYRRRTIEMTVWYVNDAPWELVLDTLLHEVAHVLSWYHNNETGHGPAWKRWCRRVGAKPERTKRLPPEVKPRARFSLTCKNRCFKVPRHRRSVSLLLDSICGTCKGDLLYIDHGKRA